MVYELTSFIMVEEFEMTGGASEIATAMGLTSTSALAYLFFNLYTPPCFAAISAMNSELQDCRWLWGAIALQFATGYTLAFVVYQVETLILYQELGQGFAPELITVCVFAAVIGAVSKRTHENFNSHYELHQLAESHA